MSATVGDVGVLQAPELARCFAARHLQELAAELLDWRKRGVLKGDRLRALAQLCAAYGNEDDSLQAAEYLVQMAALAHAAGRA